jgi:hypothetical protein
MFCVIDWTSARRRLTQAVLPPICYRPDRVRAVPKARRLAIAAAGVAAIVCALTACSPPNLSMSPNVSKSKTTGSSSRSSSPTSQATATKAAPPTSETAAESRPTGDLDTGSVTHKIPVGAFSVVVVYYTADNAKVYRDSSTKTVRVAVHIEGADTTQTILVNDFVATTDDGTARAVVKQDPRSFAITPPQSYNSVVTIPASTDKSTAVTLIVELDFSVEITPTSTLYAAQTALDSITLPLLIGAQS